MKRHMFRTFALALVAALCLSACSGGGSGAAAPDDADAVHVDCGATIAGDGSREKPLNDLTAASTVALKPGSRLLFRRGSACTGMLEPQGFGSAAAPALIGAYDSGPAPVIRADGMTTAALHLEDVSHVIVQDLELTNRGDTSTQHRGVYLTAKNALVGDVTLRRLYIHDVDGQTAFSDADKRGGGVILNVLGPLPARFDNVLIEDNRIEDVARSGVFVFGVKGASSAPRPRATESWPEASTGIVVRGNVLTRIAGDGIAVDATEGALIEENVLSEGNLSGRSFFDPAVRNCSAGIWAFNANNTVIQKNEVFRMRYGKSLTDGCDGTAFDVDYNQDGTVIQYNYSHDNEGGLILLCSDDRPRTAEIRYNLSIDDRHVFSAAPCKAPGAIGGFDGLRFYNNTIVSAAPGASIESIPLPFLYNPGSFEFRNNILYATQAQSAAIPCGNHCSNNLFFGMTASGENPVTADPLFYAASARGQGRMQIGQLFQVRPGSPAIGNGFALQGAPTTDYFGNPVPSSGAPAIGFHQPPQAGSGADGVFGGY